MNTNLPVKAHATLGASTASRWMTCPGSVQLTRHIPSVESEYAREGTAAHALAEKCLRHNADPSDYVDMELEGIVVTEDMADYVRVFVDYCREQIADEKWIEYKFSLAELNPPEQMFGTADFVSYDAAARELHVIDLKYGQGVMVEARGNKQLRYYGLGAALALGSTHPIETVKLTIVQPRMSHPDGVKRSETIDILELMDFAEDLLQAARATLEPNAPLVAGSHCRFCPISARCPAQMEQALAVAQTEFADLPVHQPPAPESLPIEVFADILDKLPILEDWVKAMHAHELHLMSQGIEVPGRKLIERRPTRKWSSEEEAQKWLEEHGYAAEEILDMTLRSPAQIERVMGRAKKDLPPELIVKKSSGYKVAPATDPHPAVTITKGEEFDLLPASPDEII
jgi:hypothetical protein